MALDKFFGITDYVVFAASLLLSFGIGVYSAFSGRKNKTTNDFYFGNQSMNIVAVALSMSATFLSAIGVLGIPAEIYMSGIGYGLVIFGGDVISSIVALVCFIPFFWNLQLTSVYEYFQRRFSPFLRRCASILFVITMMLYVAIALYAPALALSQVSGMPLWAAVVSTGLVCTAYTSVGGMKAVVWTDAFQMCIMLIGISICLVFGIISAGGLTKIFQTNLAAGRLNISFDPNPTIRHTFWTQIIGGTLTQIPAGVNQATVQRYFSVESKRAAQKMYAIQVPILVLWRVALLLLGLTMFTYYAGCDPLLAQRISRPDQMMAVFVLDVLDHLPGFPGLFIAVVYSASLSTISSGINSIVVALNEDIFKPFLAASRRPWSEAAVVTLSQVVSLLVGLLVVGMAFGASVAGTGLIQFCLSVHGICGGPMLGIFFCGMMLPFTNSKGATAGLLAGLLIGFWIGIGAILTGVQAETFPRSVDSCPSPLLPNLTAPSGPPLNPTAGLNWSAPFEECDGAQASYPCVGLFPASLGLNGLYRVSYQYYSLIGFLLTITIATLVSGATGWQDTTHIPDNYFLYKSKSVEKNLELRPTVHQNEYQYSPVKGNIFTSNSNRDDNEDAM